MSLLCLGIVQGCQSFTAVLEGSFSSGMDRDVYPIGTHRSWWRHDAGQETRVARDMACAERHRLNHTPADVSQSMNHAHFWSTTRRWTVLWLQMLNEDSPKAVLSVLGMHISATMWKKGSVMARKHTCMLITRP